MTPVLLRPCLRTFDRAIAGMHHTVDAPNSRCVANTQNPQHQGRCLPHTEQRSPLADTYSAPISFKITHIKLCSRKRHQISPRMQVRAMPCSSATKGLCGCALAACWRRKRNTPSNASGKPRAHWLLNPSDPRLLCLPPTTLSQR